jgi:hypothetical protein
MASNIDFLKKWQFERLPSKPNSFESTSSIFRMNGGNTNMEYNCILCGHDPKRFFSRSEMKQHCSDPSHCALVESLLDNQKNVNSGLLYCYSKYNQVAPRIEQLGLAAWRNEIHALLGMYLGSIGENRTAFIRAVNLFLKCEYMERISLLELTSWKAACIMDMHESKTMYDMLDWMRHGWKKNKAKLRRSTATDVIVRNVIRFLEGPRRISSFEESDVIF